MNNNSLQIEIYGEDNLILNKAIKINTKIINNIFTSNVKRSKKSYQKEYDHKSDNAYIEFLERHLKDKSIKELSVKFDCKDFSINLMSGINLEITEIVISSGGIIVSIKRSPVGIWCTSDKITQEFLESFSSFCEASFMYSQIADHFLSVTYYDLPFLIKELEA